MSQNKPDPDKDEAPISPSLAPQVFDQSDSEEEQVSEDEEQEEDDGGYQPISQEEDDDQDGLTMEQQVAALVRAGQSDAANLSSETQDLMTRAEEERRDEEVRERARLWQETKTREESIALDSDKVETIKNLMSGIKMPEMPGWVQEEQAWRERLKK